MRKLLNKLCYAHGPVGLELKVSKIAANELSKYADVTIDKNGSVIGNMGDKNSENHIMLDAHIDQIGLIVTDIDEDGFIKMSACGGIDKRILPGSTLKILGKEEILGIVGHTPPHLSKGSQDNISDIEDLFLDVGLSRDKAIKLISYGDRIVFSEKPKILLNDRFTSPSLDDRSGVAALIRCAEILSKQKLNCRVSIVFSVQEETGALGAQTAAYTLNPKEAIIVDVSFAQQPNLSNFRYAKLGGGTMIGIAPLLNKEMTDNFIALANENNIPYQLEVMGGKTGTNADLVSTTRYGIKSGLLSIPLRYMHTPVEVIDLKDIENTAELLALYIKKGVCNNGRYKIT